MKNRLKEYRKKRTLSQQALADALGVSRQTIISLENGRYDPSLPLAFQLAQEFNCHIEDLFIYQE
jgi:putative transcriptional regulator